MLSYQDLVVRAGKEAQEHLAEPAVPEDWGLKELKLTLYRGHLIIFLWRQRSVEVVFPG
jgi:hypothetical protein